MSKKKKQAASSTNEEDPEMGVIKADRNSEISANSILDVLGGLDQPQFIEQDPEGEDPQQEIDLYAERKEEDDEGQEENALDKAVYVQSLSDQQTPAQHKSTDRKNFNFIAEFEEEIKKDSTVATTKQPVNALPD